MSWTASATFISISGLIFLNRHKSSCKCSKILGYKIYSGNKITKLYYLCRRWGVTEICGLPCSFVDQCQRFGCVWSLHLQGTRKFHRNFCTCLPAYLISHPRRLSYWLFVITLYVTGFCITIEHQLGWERGWRWIKAPRKSLQKSQRQNKNSDKLSLLHMWIEIFWTFDITWSSFQLWA